MDYSWVFWDPKGEGRRQWDEKREKSWLRYLPSIFRSYPYGTIRPKQGLAPPFHQQVWAWNSSNTPQSAAPDQQHGFDQSSDLINAGHIPDVSTGTVRHHRASPHSSSEPPTHTSIRPVVSTASFVSASSQFISAPATSPASTSGSGMLEMVLFQQRYLSGSLKAGLSDHIDRRPIPAPSTPSSNYAKETEADSSARASTPPPLGYHMETQIDGGPRTLTPPHPVQDLYVPRKRISLASPVKDQRAYRSVIPSRSLPQLEKVTPPWERESNHNSTQHQRPQSWTAGDDAHVTRCSSSDAKFGLPLNPRGLRRRRGNVGDARRGNDRHYNEEIEQEQSGMGMDMGEELGGYEDEDDLDDAISVRDVT